MICMSSSSQLNSLGLKHLWSTYMYTDETIKYDEKCAFLTNTSEPVHLEDAFSNKEWNEAVGNE